MGRPRLRLLHLQRQPPPSEADLALEGIRFRLSDICASAAAHAHLFFFALGLRRGGMTHSRKRDTFPPQPRPFRAALKHRPNKTLFVKTHTL